MAGARVTICLLVFNDRRQGLVINAKRLPRCALLLQESPPGFHKLGGVDGRRYESAADLPRVTPESAPRIALSTFLRGLTITEQQTIEKSICTGVFATSRDGKIQYSDNAYGLLTRR